MSVAELSLNTDRNSEREEVWICEKNRLWDDSPRLACVGSRSGSHAACGWVTRG